MARHWYRLSVHQTQTINGRLKGRNGSAAAGNGRQHRAEAAVRGGQQTATKGREARHAGIFQDQIGEDQPDTACIFEAFDKAGTCISIDLACVAGEQG